MKEVKENVLQCQIVRPESHLKSSGFEPETLTTRSQCSTAIVLTKPHNNIIIIIIVVVWKFFLVPN
jgi:hypothetical protein